MSRAFESEASLPVLLALADAGAMCAIGVGVSSLRKRPRNPPLFFLSFSTVSGAAGSAGGAHSSALAAAASFAGASGAPQGLTFGGGSFGFAVGAHAFAGASFEAGVAVIHDSAGAPGAGALWAGAPPPGARHQSFSFGLASCAGGGCAGAL